MKDETTRQFSEEEIRKQGILRSVVLRELCSHSDRSLKDIAAGIVGHVLERYPDVKEQAGFHWQIALEEMQRELEERSTVLIPDDVADAAYDILFPPDETLETRLDTVITSDEYPETMSVIKEHRLKPEFVHEDLEGKQLEFLVTRHEFRMQRFGAQRNGYLFGDQPALLREYARTKLPPYALYVLGFGLGIVLVGGITTRLAMPNSFAAGYGWTLTAASVAASGITQAAAWSVGILQNCSRLIYEGFKESGRRFWKGIGGVIRLARSISDPKNKAQADRLFDAITNPRAAKFREYLEMLVTQYTILGKMEEAYEQFPNVPRGLPISAMDMIYDFVAEERKEYEHLWKPLKRRRKHNILKAARAYAEDPEAYGTKKYRIPAEIISEFIDVMRESYVSVSVNLDALLKTATDGEAEVVGLLKDAFVGGGQLTFFGKDTTMLAKETFYNVGAESGRRSSLLIKARVQEDRAFKGAHHLIAKLHRGVEQGVTLLGERADDVTLIVKGNPGTEVFADAEPETGPNSLMVYSDLPGEFPNPIATTCDGAIYGEMQTLSTRPTSYRIRLVEVIPNRDAALLFMRPIDEIRGSDKNHILHLDAIVYDKNFGKQLLENWDELKRREWRENR